MGYRKNIKSKRLEKQLRNCVIAEIKNNKKINEVGIGVDELSQQIGEAQQNFIAGRELLKRRVTKSENNISILYQNQRAYTEIYNKNVALISNDIGQITKRYKQLETYTMFLLGALVVQGVLLLVLSMR